LPTFFKNEKNVWKIKKRLKNVTKTKKTLKKRFYIYASSSNWP